MIPFVEVLPWAIHMAWDEGYTQAGGGCGEAKVAAWHASRAKGLWQRAVEASEHARKEREACEREGASP